MKLNSKSKLSGFTIGKNMRPYIIAEIGVNHSGSLEKAKDLIRLAKLGGANAAKFQSYKANTLASKNSPAYWDTSKEKTESQYKLFKKYDNFGPEEYKELYNCCKENKIDFVSTPFDDQAIDFLDPLIPFYKIASADITNIPFLRKIAKKNKPVLISTGASNIDEIKEAVEVLETSGSKEVIILHCVLNYPTPNENAHLAMINDLSDTFPNHTIGYSDHTLPDENMTTLMTAWLNGAVVIEKHFTHDKSLEGNDHYHAMDIQDLKNFVNIVENILQLQGNLFKKQSLDSEKISRINARRSIVLNKSITKGAKITEADLTYKRPGTGISPKYWDDVINTYAIKDLDEDHILQWGDLKKF